MYGSVLVSSHSEAFSASGLAYLWSKEAFAETLQDRHVVSTDGDVKDVFVEGV